MTASEPAGRVRRRFEVTGVVQGVGFRPFVYVAAAELALTGSVLNDVSGVVIEVEGDAAAVTDFGHRLRRNAPPLAVVEAVRESDHPPVGGPNSRSVSPRARAPAALSPPRTCRCARTAIVSCVIRPTGDSGTRSSPVPTAAPGFGSSAKTVLSTSAARRWPARGPCSPGVRSAMRNHPLGVAAQRIGTCVDAHRGMVVANTGLGGTRVVDLPIGEQLPRIC